MPASIDVTSVASSSRSKLGSPQDEEAAASAAAVMASWHEEQEDDGVPGDVCTDACLICLGDIQDRSVLPACQHSLFCFGCILRWIGIHRRCPLCSTTIGSYIIHSIRSDADYVRHRLPELSDNGIGAAADSSAEADLFRTMAEVAQRQTSSTFRRLRDRSHWCRAARKGTHEHRQDALDRWEQQLSVRRRVYRQALFCQHIGSNRKSKLTYPSSPSTIASTPSLQSTLLHFIRRELLAYPMTNLDIDFLATYAINVFKSLEIKSNEAIRLLADFLGFEGAEHFCHEVYTFARFISAGAGSHPDKVAGFDAWARYAWPEERVAERQRRLKQVGTARPTAKPAERPSASENEANQPDDDITDDRASAGTSEGEQVVQTSAPWTEIIQRRAHLLARLDAERKANHATSLQMASGDGHSGQAVHEVGFGIDAKVCAQQCGSMREKILSRLAQERLQAASSSRSKAQK